MKFYLAGPVGYGIPGVEWKSELKSYLRSCGHEVYDPIENDGKYLRVSEMNMMKENPKIYYKDIHEIMQEIFLDDCLFISDCDYLICYFIGRSYGTISEQGIAYYLKTFLNKKVKTLNIFDNTFQPDEWIICCSDEIFSNVEECIKFLRKLPK